VNHNRDNPASRLHELITLLRGGTINEYEDDSFHRRLAQILSVSPDDPLEYANPFMQVLQLPDRAAAEVHGLDDATYDSELILMWHPPVRAAFSNAIFNPNMHKLNEFRSQIDEPILLSLRFCGDLLHRRSAERLLSKDELDRIRQMVDELDEELRRDTKIDPEVRAFLLGHVKAMTQAIADAEIFGPTGLEDALDRLVGSLNRRSDIMVKAEDSPSVWTKVANIIVVIAAVFQIAGVQLALPSVIRHELTSGRPSSSQVTVVTSPHSENPKDNQGHNASDKQAEKPR